MVTTPPEEIARQHERAMEMIAAANNKDGDYAPMIDYGEIPLAWKTHPTVENPNFQCQEKEEEEEEEEKKTSSLEPQNQQNWNGCVSSRGFINIQPLADLCREGYNEPAATQTTTTTSTTNTTNHRQSSKKKNGKGATPPKTSKTAATTTTATTPPPSYTARDVKSSTNYWDDINASINNVSVIRPSHDKWGIKKIVFMFCDDFLQDVYVMPWWHLTTRYQFQETLKPVLETLQIEEHQIVRMLLANLPPGVTIPVHHDTGEWVQHTHRVHVPVIVPQNLNHILFQCGPTPTSMERINCQPGHVFEMNNQAKHSVSNCSDSEYRVHLILDYVDKDKENDKSTSSPQQYRRPRRRILLQPGEQLLQTRRSIDRALDCGKRPTPTYMILGAQKAGTTSLFEYIHQHPLAIKPKRRETHCFDWRWNTKLKSLQQQQEWCMNFFWKDELQHHPSCLTGDSTPSYLIDSIRVIPRLKQIFQHYAEMKFFIMVRDPIRRCQSHYAMVTSLDGTPAQIKARGIQWKNKTIEQTIQEDLQLLHKYGVIPYWDMKKECMDEELWNNFVNSPQEQDAWNAYITNCVPLNTGSYGIVARGLYALQIQSWLKEFTPTQFLILKLEEFQNRGIQSIMEDVWCHLGLPPYQVHDESPSNTRSYKSTMAPHTQQMLERFFTPHNQRLEHLLHNTRTGVRGGGGEVWKHPVWKY